MVSFATAKQTILSLTLVKILHHLSKFSKTVTQEEFTILQLKLPCFPWDLHQRLFSLCLSLISTFTLYSSIIQVTGYKALTNQLYIVYVCLYVYIVKPLFERHLYLNATSIWTAPLFERHLYLTATKGEGLKNEAPPFKRTPLLYDILTSSRTHDSEWSVKRCSRLMVAPCLTWSWYFDVCEKQFSNYSGICTCFKAKTSA